MLSTQNLDDATIGLYTTNGWTYNQDAQQLEREVAYQNETIVVDGKNYTTNQDGESKVQLDKINASNIKISSSSVTDTGDQNTLVVNKNSLKNGEQIMIQEVINVDEVIEAMDDSKLNNTEKKSVKTSGVTQVGGLYNGQLPSRGQYVHCNRFNGYLGNGR